MSSAITALRSTGVVALGSAVAGIGYATISNAMRSCCGSRPSRSSRPARRRFGCCTSATSTCGPGQRRKQAWIRELAGWSPTSSSTPATTSGTRRRCPPWCRPRRPVFGARHLRLRQQRLFRAETEESANYLFKPSHRITGEPLPWQDLRAAFTERGWLDMTHTRREIEVTGQLIAVAGVDDPHLARDRYERSPGRQPGRQPAARPGPLAVAPGTGPLCRRRLPTGDGRSYPRRTAVPAILRSPRDQLGLDGPAPRARRAGAPTCGCTSPRESARHRTHRCGSAAGPKPRC